MEILLKRFRASPEPDKSRLVSKINCNFVLYFDVQMTVHRDIFS